jgi:hypothetical protein
MKLAVATISLATAACNPAQQQAVQACEVFIKERLRSPSTYQQVKVDALGPAFESDGRRVKMLTIEYDAANAYGTPIRGTQQCVFDVDAKGNFSDDLEHAARMASIGADTDYAPCCLLDRDDKAANQTADQLMEESDAALKAADRALENAASLK